MSEHPVLITGVNGFVGQHMARYVQSHGIPVLGTGRSKNPSLTNLQHYVSLDLADDKGIVRLIEQFQPRFVVHLAAFSGVPDSWHKPVDVLHDNVMCALNVLEAIRRSGEISVHGAIFAGSLHEYDTSMGMQMPLTEESPTCPTSPYGWSKLLQTSLVMMYGRLYGLPVMVARTGNLIGPGATGGVCAHIASQIAAMERGQEAADLKIGDLTTKRDFLDVRDAVRAYWSLLRIKFEPGDVFNVCSGNAVSVSELIGQFHNCTNFPFRVLSQSNIERKNDPALVIGDPGKLQTRTSWCPEFPLDVSVYDTMVACRGQFVRRQK
jgi:GDP-4-dehydro-6-deoxy-D-mannose reductase